MECTYTTAPSELEGNPFLSMPEWNIEVAHVGKLLQKLNPGAQTVYRTGYLNCAQACSYANIHI